MRKILYLLGLLLFGSFAFSQNAIILNGGYIRLDGGTVANPIYIVVNQSATTGIIRPGGGHIHSENQYNLVKWITSTTTGNYIFPFGVDGTAADYIPFEFNKTTAGNADITISTYSTNAANTPFATPVTSMPQAPSAIDRFWDIRSTTTVTAGLTFRYRGIENTVASCATDTIKAQYWNNMPGPWSAVFGPGNPGVTAGIGTVGSITNQNYFQPTETVWALRTVTISPSVTATSSITCNGASNGTATITTSGGLGPYTYAWAPSANTTSVGTGLGPGIHTVTVTGANSCSRTQTLTITQPSATTLSINQTVVTCTSNASATVTPSGGTPSYTAYAWSPAISTTNTASGLTATNYTVTVTDNNGCNTSTVIAITANTTAPTPSITVPVMLTCSTTSMIINGTPTTSVTYSWSGPSGFTSSAQNPTITLPGTYNLTVTSTVNGCPGSTVASVTQNTVAPSISSTGSGSLNCTVLNTSVTVSTPTTPVSYLWTGTGITGGATTATATVNQAGTFTYAITNTTNNCTSTGTVLVTQNTASPSITSTSSGSLNCTVLSTSVTVATSTTPVSYLWTGTGITGGATTATATVNQAGTFTFAVTNTTNNCTTTNTVLVTQNTSSPSITSTSAGSLNCIVLSTSVSVSTSTTPVTYSWSGPSSFTSSVQSPTTITLPGTYTFAVTNTTNNCTTTNTVSVIQNTTTPTTSSVATQTITCASPSVTLIGSANPSSCTVVWTGGVCGGSNSFTATACAPGTYTYIATNPANGCPSAAQVATVVPNSSIPSATLVNTGTITCNTTTVQVTATSTASPVSYSWSGPGVVSGSTTPTVTVNAGGTYSLVLLNTSNSCSVMITNSVTADNAAVSPTTTASNTITCNTTTVSLTTNAGSGSYSYNWGGPAIVGTNTLSTATASLGGVYTVTVTNTVNGCTGTGTVSVASNTTVPTGVAITPATFTLSCSTPTTVLTATATGATSYTWIAPAGGSIISGTNTANAGISGSGTYSVIVAGSNGCPAAAVEATISPNNNAPTFTLSNAAPSITCFSATPSVSVTITSTVPITSYNWSPSSGIQGSTTTSVVTFTAAGTYTGVITANNGCVSNAIVSVADNTALPNVVAGTATAQAISCLNPSVVIAPTYTPSSGLTYTWSGPGLVGSANDASVTVNQNGTYSLSITNTVTGCTSTIVTVPVVGTTIPPVLNVTSSSSVGIGCLPGTSTVILTANATPSTGVTYLWSNASTAGSISVTSAGVYSVVVTDVSTSCSVAVQYTVDNNTAQPNVNAGANAAIPCGSTTSTLTLNGSSTSTNVAFSWTGPGIVSGANTATPIVNQPGTYTLVVTNTVTGCTASGTVNVANGTPTASFTPDVTQGPLPLAVTFTNQSSGASNFSWVINGGYSTPSATTFNFNNTFTSAGSQTVTLIAYNGTCSDSMSVVIIVDEGFSIEIPNVFTPNNDGVNDHFTIKSTGVKEITLEIYNRWGQKMYEFSGAKAAWDGKTGAGNEASDGTYFYFVKATGYDGKTYEKQGPVSLFR